MPVYIRGIGEPGDPIHAGFYKALMIIMLNVDVYYEDDPVHASIIQQNCPRVQIKAVKHNGSAAGPNPADSPFDPGHSLP